jgi:hypothetical protein
MPTRQRSVTPNTRWRSPRRRSNEKSAKQIQREVADYQKFMADLGKISVELPRPDGPMPQYGTGTGPRAQQAKRHK